MKVSTRPTEDEAAYNALPFTHDFTLDSPKLAGQKSGDVQGLSQWFRWTTKGKKCSRYYQYQSRTGGRSNWAEYRNGADHSIARVQSEKLDHGDDWWFQQHGKAKSDSKGLFQQRPGWGSNEDRMNPEASAKLFYKALMQVPNRDQMEIGVAAQTVQRFAFPTPIGNGNLRQRRFCRG